MIIGSREHGAGLSLGVWGSGRFAIAGSSLLTFKTAIDQITLIVLRIGDRSSG
jgi:hypothetical protein